MEALNCKSEAGALDGPCRMALFGVQMSDVLSSLAKDGSQEASAITMRLGWLARAAFVLLQPAASFKSRARSFSCRTRALSNSVILSVVPAARSTAAALRIGSLQCGQSQIWLGSTGSGPGKSTSGFSGPSGGSLPGIGAGKGCGGRKGSLGTRKPNEIFIEIKIKTKTRS
jgi:hypothetical protein